MDAESVHHFTVRQLEFLSKFSLFNSSKSFQNDHPCTRIGLAAGFDKNCEILPLLPFFGFGFAEIGTITPKAQPGNDKPRLFRDPQNENLFNRMGFNNLGSEIISKRLEKIRLKNQLPSHFRVGVNVGKNKDTDLSESASDYRKCIQAFKDLADYFVINVSSPNTPGLRSLQSVEFLDKIISESQNEILKWKKKVPVYLKLAPECDENLLKDILQNGKKWDLEGWVLTNTLAGVHQNGSSGGFSGKILTEKSREVLKLSKSMTDLKIISVGGIHSKEEAETRFRLGADAIQIYSAWIFNGPFFPKSLY